MSWKPASYYRTTFALSPTIQRGGGDGSLLPKTYNVKSVNIGKAPPNARIYVADNGATTQNIGFTRGTPNKAEATVVFDTLGNGRVGWAGDVNGEEESTAIILWLAGLPVAESPKLPSTGFREFTIKWSPNGAPAARSVAIGRGGAPFVWHLLEVKLGLC